MAGKAALGALFALVALFGGSVAHASYGRVAESTMDPGIFRIDEKQHLGNRIDGTIRLVDQDGVQFKLGDLFGKPLVLLLSYYRCDGVCSTVNADFNKALQNAARVKPGADYRILTLSFDKYDTAETLSHFRGDLSLPSQVAREWKHSLAINKGDIGALANSVGFRYFWSPRDRTFFHPNVYIFISPDGRIARYLYASGVGSRDIELAVLETAQGDIRPSQVTDWALSLCYSYNFKEGKYTLNIPLFVGMGSLAIGGVSILISVFVIRKRRTKEEVS